MIRTFSIMAHPVINAIPLAGQMTDAWQLPEYDYQVENMASTLAWDAAQTFGVLATQTLGQVGAGGYPLQNTPLPGAVFLPRFQHSGQWNPLRLVANERIEKTYNNVSGAAVNYLQTAWYGHKCGTKQYRYETLRPYLLATPELTLPGAAGSTVSATIQVGADTDLLVRAWCGYPISNHVTVRVTDLTTGYRYTNTDIATSLAVYEYDLASGANFHPRPWSPWILPRASRLEIVFTQLAATDPALVRFLLFGNLCTYTELA